MFNFLFNKIWGENPLTFYFSFKGTFNRLQFCGAIVTVNILIKLIEEQVSWLLYVLIFPLAFCATLAALQKRCRDINYKGTIATIALSLVYGFDANQITYHNWLQDTWEVFTVCYMLIVFFLLFFPGRKEKKPDIVDPLLKRPYLYVLIWSILFWLGEAICDYQDFVIPAAA